MSRDTRFAEAEANDYDVVVIGGGVTGASAAWDASLRGLRVLLLERGDFGGSTSAHSLKILHGGIRYLQHLDIPRLRQSCAERGAFLRMAPHLTTPREFVVPTYGYGLQGKAVFRAALLLLHLLTLDRNRGIDDPGRKIPLGHTISRDEALRRFPDIEPAGLTGAAVFYDGAILNPPRMVFEIVQSAVEAGAGALNYCEVTNVRTSATGNEVVAVSARDVLTDRILEFRTRSVINAAGPGAPWLPVAGEPASVSPPFSRDMAFVIRRTGADPAALAVQTRYRDPDAVLTRGNRHLFMVPWRDYTLVGVNSRVFDEHPDSLDVSEAEIDEFISEINDACPRLMLRRGDILAVNAGLLPFGENASGATNLSFGKRSLVRDHSAHGGPSGLVTAISVRWTMGRATAEAAVDNVERQLKGRASACRTRQAAVRSATTVPLAGMRADIRADGVLADLSDRHIDSLLVNYGSRWTEFRDLASRDPSMKAPIGDSATLRGQVHLAAERELATCLSDVVLRRTDLGSGEQPSDADLTIAADIMAAVLGWSSARKHREIAAVGKLYPFYGSAPAAGHNKQVA